MCSHKTQMESKTLTDDKKIREKTKTDRRVQYLIAACVSLATMTTGAVSSWPAPVLPKLYDNETDIVISPTEMAWMVSISSPGFMAGSFLTRFTADSLGRRNTLLASLIPILIGMTAVAFTAHAWCLFFTRFLWGCGNAMITTISGIYLAEIAEKDIRGTLSLITRFMFNFGNLLIMTIGPFVSYTTLNYMLFALPISYFISCCWIPETPYQHLKEGKMDAARKSLRMLRGYENDKVLEADLQEMRAQVTTEMRRSTTFKEFITGKQYRKTIIIAVGLKTAQLLGGQLLIQQYVGLIMKESRSEMKLSKVFVIFGAVRFFVCVLSSIVVDKMGRRPLVIYSYIGTGLSLAILGLYFILLEVVKLDQASLRPYSFLPFTGLILSIIISTLGYNSVTLVVIGEIFPLNIKAVATSSLAVFGGSFNFLVFISYQTVKDWLGLAGVFWIFAATSFLAAVFCYILLPETKGKSLKEIQQILQGDLYEDEKVQKRFNVNVENRGS